MAVGTTTTQSLADSLPLVIDAARIVREQEGGMPQLVERHVLPKGTGVSWEEVSLSQLNGVTAITENTELDNPQQVIDSLMTITPTMFGLTTVLTDEVQRRITPLVYAKIGQLAQNNMQRKKDEDGLVVLDGATTQLGSAGSSLNSGLIGAAGRRITSNATEPGMPPLRGVFHGFQIYDIETELRAPVGTYEITSGETARVFREQFRGQVAGVQIFENGNLTIDSADDVKGGVFAKEAILLIEGYELKKEMKRRPELGGGADQLFLYESYAYGERNAGGWLFEVISDATAPTG